MPRDLFVFDSARFSFFSILPAFARSGCPCRIVGAFSQPPPRTRSLGRCVHTSFLSTTSTMSYQMAPATPQRPGPGAFINTPAPNRPGLQRQASISQPQPQQQQALPAPPVESPIDRASRTINSVLDRDSRFPSLEAYIGREYLGRARWACLWMLTKA